MNEKRMNKKGRKKTPHAGRVMSERLQMQISNMEELESLALLQVRNVHSFNAFPPDIRLCRC